MSRLSRVSVPALALALLVQCGAGTATKSDTAPPTSATPAPAGAAVLFIGTGRAVSRIRSRAWSVVVLQQGPSTLPDSRTLLVRDARRLADEVRAGAGDPRCWRCGRCRDSGRRT